MYGIQGEDSMSNTKEQKIGYRDIFRQTEYMKIMIAAKKWTGKAWDWGLTLDQLCIYFGDRIQPEDID